MQVRSGQAGNCPGVAWSQLALLFASSSVYLEPLPLQRKRNHRKIKTAMSKPAGTERAQALTIPLTTKAICTIHMKTSWETSSNIDNASSNSRKFHKLNSTKPLIHSSQVRQLRRRPHHQTTPVGLLNFPFSAAVNSVPLTFKDLAKSLSHVSESSGNKGIS